MIRLTDEQALAAADPSKLVNIVSAPGSGKTTVAAERFGFHRFQGADDRGVMGLTFNRAAASEFHRRITRRWGAHALSYPHRVVTFDHLYVDFLKRLLAEKLIDWPGGHVEIDVRDDYRGLDGFTGWLQPGHWRRHATLDSAGRVVTGRRQLSKRESGVGQAVKHSAILEQGIVDHDDIRYLIQAVLKSEALRDQLSSWIGNGYRSVVIDEVYDADALDLRIVRMAADTGLAVTVIGDPWQALYKWRGAKPQLVARLLDVTDERFVGRPLTHSFRFTGEQMPNLAAALRRGEGTVLPAVSSNDVDVALSGMWRTLWNAGDNILPLAFRNVNNDSDAAILLLLDVVTRSRLGEQAHGRDNAIAKLKLDRETFLMKQRELMQPLVSRLRSGEDPSTVLEALRMSIKSLGVRKPSRLPNAEKEAALAGQLEQIATRLQQPRLIPGLTVFQAKGREWQRVGLVLSPTQIAMLAGGLKDSEEDHCVLYVAVTRAMERCGRLAADLELDWRDVESTSQA